MQHRDDCLWGDCVRVAVRRTAKAPQAEARSPSVTEGNTDRPQRGAPGDRPLAAAIGTRSLTLGEDAATDGTPAARRAGEGGVPGRAGGAPGLPRGDGLRLLADHGWEVVEVLAPDDWWADEFWKVQSRRNA